MPSNQNAICDCGQPATKQRCNYKIFKRCYDLERAGCVGGPNIKKLKRAQKIKS